MKLDGPKEDKENTYWENQTENISRWYGREKGQWTGHVARLNDER